jgi:NhaP-type Na+/H+ or K+/H+ antiporter
LIDYRKQAKLFSICFGEGITNDAVSIILFNAVFKYTAPTEHFTANTAIKISIEFTKLTVSSIFIALIFSFT